MEKYYEYNTFTGQIFDAKIKKRNCLVSLIFLDS